MGMRQGISLGDRGDRDPVCRRRDRAAAATASRCHGLRRHQRDRHGRRDRSVSAGATRLEIVLPNGRAARSIRRSSTSPFHDPYVATITAGALSPDGLTPGAKREVVHVPLLRRADPPPLLKGRDQVSVALYRQQGPAPLVFVLGGGIGARTLTSGGPALSRGSCTVRARTSSSCPRR